MNNLSLFFLGCILGSIVGVITGITWITINDNKQKYARKCLNCRHCIPWESKEGMTKLYCDLAVDNRISTFPVREYGCCGHFELTEELKAEQVKDKAEKNSKIKNVKSITKITNGRALRHLNELLTKKALIILNELKEK